MRRSCAFGRLFPLLLSWGLQPAFSAVTFLDLSRAANMGPEQSFDGAVAGGEELREKEGLANIPQGPQTLRGVSFLLLDSTKNQGRSFVVLKGKRQAGFPEAVAFPAADLKAGYLYFLHSCRWGGTAPNVTVAEYDVIYGDGQVAVIPLRVGMEITNFTGADDTPASFLAWWHKYKNTDMGISLFPWKNPRPDVPIQTILFKSLGKMPVPLLFAITASDTELSVSPVSPKPEKTFQTDTRGWIPLQAPACSPAGTAIDMSFLLDAPAGKHGRIKADGEKLVFEDGTPARFWGVKFNNKNDSLPGLSLPVAAQILPFYGCNIVSFDIPPADEAAPDLKDLVESFKAKGIYVELDCDDQRVVSSGVCEDPAVVPKKIWIAGQATQNDPTDNPGVPFNFNDDPMVLHPGESFPAQLNCQRKLGIPFLSEWFRGWPNEYLAETPLLMSVYGTFEDWAGCLNIETINGGIRSINATSPNGGKEDQPNDQAILDRDPSFDFQLPVAALAYLRGDLKEGKVFVLGKGGDGLKALAHKTGVNPEGGKFKTDVSGEMKAKVNERTQSIISDTGQINWQGNVGVAQVSSPRFQAVIGFIGHRKLSSPIWQVESPNYFASLSLISLTKTNLWASDHMLLTGMARMENTGQVYNATKTKLISQGQAPILVEPLQAKITLCRYKPDSQLRVRALDASGQSLKTKVHFKWVKNNLVFSWVPGAFYLEIYKPKK